MSSVPAALDFGKTIFDFDVHPSQDLVVTGLITGRVLLHRYALDGHAHQWTAKPCKKSCRGVRFAPPDGRTLYSISKDKSIALMDTETGKLVRIKENAHE